MYITKQKQTHRYREQTSGYQWGEGKGEGQNRIKGFAYSLEKNEGICRWHDSRNLEKSY